MEKVISAQQVEIIAVTTAIKHIPEEFNLYTDSKYVLIFPQIYRQLL